MTITRYFERGISTATTIHPDTIEIDKETYDERLGLYSIYPAFIYGREYTDDSWGKPIDIKVISIATNTPAMVQFFVIHGDEYFVEQEAYYLTHN